MKFENKGKWISQIAESVELDSPENEEMALDMSEDEDIETQDEIEKEDEKDIEEISEEDKVEEDEENIDILAEDDLDLVKDKEIIDESWTDIYPILGDIGEKRYFNKQKELSRDLMEKEFRKVLKDKGLKPTEHDIEVALTKYYDESAQKNESLDEKAIKDYLNKEHSRALKNVKNMSADDSDSFYKGYATAIHELQRKFNL